MLTACRGPTVRMGRGLKIVNDLEELGVARDRIELPTRGKKRGDKQ